jgi:ribosome recycling factor
MRKVLATLRVSKLNLSSLHTLRALHTIVAVLSIMLVGNSVALAAGVPLDPIKLKQTLTQRGIGKGIKVKELDGTTLTGVLTGIHDDSLEVAPAKTVQSITIQYAQITSVHNNGVGKGAKVGIGILIGVGAFCTVLVVWAAIALSR